MRCDGQPDWQETRAATAEGQDSSQKKRSMKRIAKTLYVDSNNRDLISLKGTVVNIECAYRNFTPDELDELASAASAAAEELRVLSTCVPAIQSEVEA